MANFNSNYFYDDLPTQQFEEYGDYADSGTPETTLTYVQSIYTILYPGVTSFEFNGTTYFNYNVYEAPPLNYYNYSSCDYSTESGAVNYISNIDPEDGSVSQENYAQSYYNYSSCDYSTESGAVNYISNIDPEDESVSQEIDAQSYYNYSSCDYPTESGAVNYISNIDPEDESVSQEIDAQSYYDYSSCDYSTEGGAVNYISNIDPEDESVSQEIDAQSYYNYSSCDYLTRSGAVNYISNIDPEDESVSQEIDAQTSYDYDSVCSDMSPDSSTEDAVNVNTESNGQSVNVSENYLNEYCEEQPFVYEGNRVLDWSIDVEDDDIKEDEEEKKLSVYEGNQMSNWRSDVEKGDTGEEDVDFVKANSPTIDERDIYQSKEVIKYLKENLYLYALSGHMHLKESVPVVDILPIIEEESESEEEYDTLEGTVDDLEGKGEIIFCVKENNIACDITFDRSDHNYALESAVENLEPAKENVPNLLENDVVSDLTLDTPEPFIEERNLEPAHLEQVKEDITNKKGFICLTSDEETDLFGGNVSRPHVIDHVFDSALQKSEIPQLEKDNTSKLQDDRIKIMEKFIATDIAPSCFNDDILLNLTEESLNRKEITLHPIHCKHSPNISCYDLPETASQGECFSEAMVEKTRENNGEVSSKRKKKKFQSFRKWLSNLFCCARKET